MCLAVLFMLFAFLYRAKIPNEEPAQRVSQNRRQVTRKQKKRKNKMNVNHSVPAQRRRPAEENDERFTRTVRKLYI